MDTNVKDLKNLEPEKVALLLAKYERTQKPKSRAQYRVNATRKWHYSMCLSDNSLSSSVFAASDPPFPACAPPPTGQMFGGKRVNSDAVTKQDLQELLQSAATGANGGDESRSGKYKGKGVVQFAATSYEVYENEQFVVLHVSRVGEEKKECEVVYETSNGSAIAGEDYKYSSGKCVFAPGETSKEIKIEIIDDNEYEPDEDFFVTLSSKHADTAVGGNHVRSERERSRGLCAHAGVTRERERDAYVKFHVSHPNP